MKEEGLLVSPSSTTPSIFAFVRERVFEEMVIKRMCHLINETVERI